MNNQLDHCYFVLKLKPGSSWSEIRKAYKNLIKIWHPDHFQQDINSRQIAEERTMEITQAYKALADYRKKHGSTPSSIIPFNEREFRETSSHIDKPTASATAADTHADIPEWVPDANVGRKVFFVLTAVALLLYLWFLEEPTEHGAWPNNIATDLSQAGTNGKTIPLPAGSFFTIGSKPGEVYAAQGIPSETESGVWHYGRSRVYFTNGGVTHWVSDPADPLKADFDVDLQTDEKNFFERGSTKEKVRALQGTPWRQSETEWVYGTSRIFFSGDLVTGWEDSPLNPLKIK